MKSFWLDYWKRTTDREILTTTICLFERSSNARPLVPASPDASHLAVLTPNHFLLGTSSSNLPSNLSSNFNNRKRYARAQACFDAIWSWCLKEYVPTLNRRSKWSNSTDRDLITSGLVWIVEATGPGIHYLFARVVEINYGSDAIARSAEVKTMLGNLIRPIVKLGPVLPPWSLVFSLTLFSLTFCRSNSETLYLTSSNM